MSLRKKACSSCVAAKRKCDSAFPTCHRCAQRSLACHYAYPPTAAIPDDRSNHRMRQGNFSESRISPPCHLSTRSASSDSMMDESMFINHTHLNLTADDDICLEQSGPSLYSDIWMLAGEPCSSSIVETARVYGYDHKTSTSHSWPVSFDRRILEFYPRVDDKETWMFCVMTLLTQVDIFLRTGSAFFVHPSSQSGENLPPPLRAAYGVCSSYKVRTESTLPFYQQLLANEVDNLLAQPPPVMLQEQLGDLCAILLYFVITNFGGTSRRGLAQQSEMLLAQRTACLENLELATRQSTATLTEAGLLSGEEAAWLWYLCDSGRKLVVVSYLAREICHILQFKTCYLLRQIVALPVSKKSVYPPGFLHSPERATSEPWRDVVSYDQLVRDWETGKLGVVDEFTHFLISTCKGVHAM